ncbi:hypothetical protein X777_01962 [Ooceraea biroi]|uniref:Uncharacterized protein n=1 Tax=Ooceraea biroi TaxID=2015173 RepID=A0A026WPG5_OOCBI|nr:hypothetical protein X777_01962 [Ooceraea biroi]
MHENFGSRESLLLRRAERGSSRMVRAGLHSLWIQIAMEHRGAPPWYAAYIVLSSSGEAKDPERKADDDGSYAASANAETEHEMHSTARRRCISHGGSRHASRAIRARVQARISDYWNVEWKMRGSLSSGGKMVRDYWEDNVN